MDFLNTIAGREFAVHIKTIARNLSNKEVVSEKEKMTRQLYLMLVAQDFSQDGGMSYEELKAKAKESVDAYFS